MWTGSEWILVGDGGGLSPQAASAIYLSQSNASVIYATTYLNVNELNIEDNLIVLNYGVSGSPSLSAGIEIERGTSPNVSIQWNEFNDRWEFTKDGSTYKELGSGAVLYQSASPDAVALGLEVGSVWIDSDANAEDAVGTNHIHGQYLSISSASSTYATKSELAAFSPENFLIKAEAYTANISDTVFVNTALGAYIITLPTSATLGDNLKIIDLANNAETNNITVDPNGLNIDGASGNFIIDINNAGVEFIYTNNTYGWRTING